MIYDSGPGVMMYLMGLMAILYLPAVAVLSTGLLLNYSFSDCATAEDMAELDQTIMMMLLIGGIFTGVGLIAWFLMGLAPAPFILAVPMIAISLIVNAVMRSVKCPKPLSDEEKNNQYYYYGFGFGILVLIAILLRVAYNEIMPHVRFAMGDMQLG